jgi:hypothetical protein
MRQHSRFYPRSRAESDSHAPSENRTMGRKHVVPYGLYRIWHIGRHPEITLNLPRSRRTLGTLGQL